MQSAQAMLTTYSKHRVGDITCHLPGTTEAAKNMACQLYALDDVSLVTFIVWLQAVQGRYAGGGGREVRVGLYSIPCGVRTQLNAPRPDERLCCACMLRVKPNERLPIRPCAHAMTLAVAAPSGA